MRSERKLHQDFTASIYIRKRLVLPQRASTLCPANTCVHPLGLS